MSWTFETEGGLSKLDAAVLERMGKPAIAERLKVLTDAVYMVLTAIQRAAGTDMALQVAAQALAETKTAQPRDHGRRWAETEQWLDKLADDLGLSDSQYVSARVSAYGLVKSLPGLSPFLTAALAVDMEARRGNAEVR